MFNDKQNELMLKAVDLLNEANCAMQQALGATDECLDLHTAITSLEDDLLEIVRINNPEEIE